MTKKYLCQIFGHIKTCVTVSHGTKMSKRASKPWISQYFDCADSNIISEVEGMVRRGTTVEGV